MGGLVVQGTVVAIALLRQRSVDPFAPRDLFLRPLVCHNEVALHLLSVAGQALSPFGAHPYQGRAKEPQYYDFDDRLRGRATRAANVEGLEHSEEEPVVGEHVSRGAKHGDDHRQRPADLDSGFVFRRHQLARRDSLAFRLQEASPSTVCISWSHCRPSAGIGERP